MNKKIEVLKEAIPKILILYVSLLIILKIVFFKEEVVNILLIGSSIFYLFFLPGSISLLYLHKRFSFLERFVLGTILTIALTGIISYYLSLILDFHLEYHGYVITPVIIFLGLFLLYKSKD